MEGKMTPTLTTEKVGMVYDQFTAAEEEYLL